jgi:hypothetical protein
MAPLRISSTTSGEPLIQRAKGQASGPVPSVSRKMTFFAFGGAATTGTAATIRIARKASDIPFFMEPPW